MKPLKAVKVASRLINGAKNSLYYRFASHRIKPKLLVFEVTRRCNSRCRICDIWKLKIGGKEITVSELEKVLSDSLFSDLEDVILTGGEPTLRSDLFELILAIHSVTGARVWISTNGLLPKKVLEVVKKCLVNEIKIGVGVSLDGVEQEHDFIRGVDGAFKKATFLLEKLKQMGVNPTIGFTLSSLTVDNYFPLKRWVGDRFALLVQKFDSSSFYNTKKSRHELGDAEKVVVEDLQDSLLKRYWLSGEGWRCYALHSFFVLRCNGDVSPCLKRYDMVVGNMLEDKPGVVWRRIEKARKQVKSCASQSLNDWAFGESMKSEYSQIFWFKLGKLLG